LGEAVKKYLIEFIGTFLLVLTIGLSSGNALAIGAVLVALVYMGGYISGGHYNPAVTLSILLLRKIKGSEAGMYIFVQLLAALVAAGTFQLIQDKNLVVAPGTGVSFAAALAVEIIFTFALVSTVLHVAVSKKTENNNYYGLAIGLIVMAAVFAGGAISGGAFNPAVGIGVNLYDLSLLSENLSNIWLYLAGPIVGGILATYVFRYTQDS
jgi:aquaporin Z